MAMYIFFKLYILKTFMTPYVIFNALSSVKLFKIIQNYLNLSNKKDNLVPFKTV